MNVGKWGTQIDYSERPERFETYSHLDQQRIHEQLATSRHHYRQAD